MYDGQVVQKGKGKARPKLADVRQVVCEGEGIAPELIRAPSHKWAISHPRQIAMWLARTVTEASYPQIATFFGKYDHTTALYAFRKIEARAAADPEFREKLTGYRNRVQAIAMARVPEVSETLAQEVSEANELLRAGDSSGWSHEPPRRLTKAQRTLRAIDEASWMKLGGEMVA